MFDIEAVVLSLTVEYLSIHGENSLFKHKENASIINLIARNLHNKISRKIYEFAKLIRSYLQRGFNECEDYFVIDSMLLEECKMFLHLRIKVCREVFETTNITFATLTKVDQKDFKKQPDIFKKTKNKTGAVF